MNNAAMYQLPTFSGVVSHGWLLPRFVRDVASEEYRSTTEVEIDAQVRSGDYFVTLATTLDSLGKNVAHHAIRNELEDIVSDLIYLQDQYEIKKK